MPHEASKNKTVYMNYPANIGNDVAAGEHYMMINSYESLNAVNTGATMKSSIALYIPPNSMKTSFAANYNGMEGGALKAAAVSGAKRLAGAESPIDQMVSNIGGAFSGAAAEIERRTAALADKTGFISAGMGLAVNNHIALVYQGPSEFRTHDFTFQFWPKNNLEARIVKHIITDFQNGMLPRMVGSASTGSTVNSRRLSAPYFKSPRHYKIKFYQGNRSNENLFKIKTSVMTSMQVNHDPEGIVAFHDDGYPVHTSLTVQFKEIEFVTSEDAVASSLNAEVDALVANQAQAARVQEIQDGLDAMAAGGGKRGSRAVRDSSGKIRVVGGL